MSTQGSAVAPAQRNGAAAVFAHLADPATELARLQAICRRPTAWQFVIHGHASHYRAEVLRIMQPAWSNDRMERFARCGQGDTCYTTHRSIDKGQQFNVIPQVCGERLCPRCSRRSGVRMLKSLDHRMQHHGHNWLYHIVVTQRVIPDEPLATTFARIDAKTTKVLQRARADGIDGGCRVTHVKWSRHHGWHVHTHCIVESTHPFDETQTRNAWAAFDDTNEEAFYCAQISKPKTAVDLTEFDPNLFDNRPDAAGAALGYVLGELTQGVNAFPELDFPDAAIEEFAQWVCGKQMVRRFGTWRETAAQKTEREAAEREERKATPPPAESVSLGLVDDVFHAARRGVRDAQAFTKFLADRYASGTTVGKRLRDVFHVHGFQ